MLVAAAELVEGGACRVLLTSRGGRVSGDANGGGHLDDALRRVALLVAMDVGDGEETHSPSGG